MSIMHEFNLWAQYCILFGFFVIWVLVVLELYELIIEAYPAFSIFWIVSLFNSNSKLAINRSNSLPLTLLVTTRICSSFHGWNRKMCPYSPFVGGNWFSLIKSKSPSLSAFHLERCCKLFKYSWVYLFQISWVDFETRFRIMLRFFSLAFESGCANNYLLMRKYPRLRVFI